MAEIRFDRGMRWLPLSQTTFSRPIRWLTALHGNQVVPYAHAGLIASARTRGLRSGEDDEIRLREALDYESELDRRGVVLDPEARRIRIQEDCARLAAEVEGTAVPDAELLSEVVDLVEAPAVLRGRVDEEFLRLPRPVLVAVMKKYQRYFAVERSGDLLPYFLAVANGLRDNLDPIREGNESVLRARFADAAYFVRRDLEQPLEAYRARLAGLIFHSKRGTVLEKSDRLVRLVDWVGQVIGWAPTDAEAAGRAAHLCKADLATRMVVEITALHGEIGREYALQGGEATAVAEAIFEHVLPRTPGDQIPRTAAGTALAVADRLDSLAAFFSVGAEPSGTRDPFGLRRVALGLIQILLARNIRFGVDQGLRKALEILSLGGPEAEAALVRSQEFVRTRLHVFLLSNGHRHDAVDAILATHGSDPAGASQAVVELETWMGRPDWPVVLQAFARCQRIQEAGADDAEVEVSLLREDAERALHTAVLEAELRRPFGGSPSRFLEAFRDLVPPITRFFEDVLVMAEDDSLRRNRLRLLRRIHGLADGVTDLSKLEGF
jgi:glycyl-tRNA synthetase